MRNVTTLASSTSVRTLILGIDPAGRIVWHDRNSQEVLDPGGGALLGAPLHDLVMGGTAGTPLPGLLEAGRSGREATAVLTLRARRGDPIDAVVIDVAMAKMTGPELAALVATLPNAPPVVLVSGFRQDTSATASAFIPKPFLPDQLTNTVGRLLSDLSSARPIH